MDSAFCRAHSFSLDQVSSPHRFGLNQDIKCFIRFGTHAFFICVNTMFIAMHQLHLE